MTDNPITAYADTLPEEQRDELRSMLASMVAGGFQVTADGKARSASMQEKLVLARVALRYGLDPLMGDLYLMGGRPYPAHRALYRSAVRAGYVVEARPMTREERDLYGIEAEEHGWISVVHGPDGRRVASDFGTACEADCAIARGRGGRRVLRHMAQKRAERRALDKAYGCTSYDAADPLEPQQGRTVEAQPEAVDARPPSQGEALLLEADEAAPVDAGAEAPQQDEIPW